MQPSDRQLLKQLRKATAQLLKESSSREHQALLGAMHVVLNELLLRNNRDFFVDYYRRGHRLLEEGVAQAGQDTAPLKIELGSLPSHLDSKLALDVIAPQVVQLSGLLEQVVNAVG